MREVRAIPLRWAACIIWTLVQTGGPGTGRQGSRKFCMTLPFPTARPARGPYHEPNPIRRLLLAYKPSELASRRRAARAPCLCLLLASGSGAAAAGGKEPEDLTESSPGLQTMVLGSCVDFGSLLLMFEAVLCSSMDHT